MPHLMHWLQTLLLSVLTLTATATHAQEDFLDPEQAFPLQVEMIDGQHVRASWETAKGYYLYRDRISFTSKTDGISLDAPALPSATLKNDPNFGDVYIYKGKLSIDVPVRGSGTFDLLVKYQGCADAGLCYPPQKKTFSLSASAAPAPAATSGMSLNELMAKATGGGSSGNGDLLTPEQAFAFTGQQQGDQLMLSWKVAPGYYLYQDRLKINGSAIDPARLPTAETKQDPVFGQVQVYKHDVSTSLPLAGLNGEVSISWQGCAEAGVCYPPQKATLTLNNDGSSQKAADFDTAAAAELSESDRIASMLSGGNLWLTIAFFFGVGLLLAFTPCVFPMIPILSSIIVGQGQGITTRRAFTLSLVYVLAMALTYTAAGVLAGLFGANLQAAFQNPWILITFSAVFVALALSMFGFYELQLPASLQAKLADVSNKQQGGTLTGVAIMGLLSALIVGPCVAPPLAGALIYIGQTGDALLGGAALFALSMGMGVPLLLVGTAAGKFMPRAGGWMDAVKAVFGVALLGVAIWMLSRILPDALTLVLWALLAIASAVYLGALDSATSGFQRLWKALGVALLLWGAFLLVAVASGGNSALTPLKHLAGGGTGHAAQVSAHPSFRQVSSLGELDSALKEASQQGKIVMLDFYADWCVSCKEMEQFTFADPTVASKLGQLMLLQADITANTPEHQALLKRFGLVGPPAILFFDANGQEQRPLRVVGFMKAADFARQLDKASAR